MAGQSKLQSLDKNKLSVIGFVAQLYLSQLNANPVLTKALTSAFITGLSDLIAQEIRNIKERRERKTYSFTKAAAFAGFGLLAGPLYHYWYLALDRLVPPDARWAAVKKICLDRLIFAPVMLAAYFYAVPLLEGKSQSHIQATFKAQYWKTLVLSWRFWSPIQYFVINHAPPQCRVLIGNLVALVWNVFLSLRRSAAPSGDIVKQPHDTS